MAAFADSICAATEVNMGDNAWEMVNFFTNSTNLPWERLVETVPTIAAQYCACEEAFKCYGICPNPDLAGIGVRVAFYFQSLANGWLIFKSPEDAAQGAWASTVLTGALTIPALIQKFQGELTLHHATLVLNFATLSTISSLAVAPMVPIWRQGVRSQQDHLRLPSISPGGGGSPLQPHQGFPEPTAREISKTRGRVVLSIALLMQIILQWSWCILLFTSPKYSGACSASTNIIFIAGLKKAHQINEHFVIWGLWLLFCMMMTLTYGVIMVLSCPSPVHDLRHFPQHNPRTLAGVRRRPTLRERGEKVIPRWIMYPSKIFPRDKHFGMRIFIRATQVLAFFLACFYVAISEAQMALNNTLEGEQNIWSFSQTAAILLALAPAWALAVATFTPAIHLSGHNPSEPYANFEVTEAFEWPIREPTPTPPAPQYQYQNQPGHYHQLTDNSSHLQSASESTVNFDSTNVDPGFPFYAPAGISRYPAATMSGPPSGSRLRALSLGQRHSRSSSESVSGSSRPFYVRRPYISAARGSPPIAEHEASSSYEMDETRQPLIGHSAQSSGADEADRQDNDTSPDPAPVPTMPIPDPYNRQARSPEPSAPGFVLPSIP